jgi:hypothetical protein
MTHNFLRRQVRRQTSTVMDIMQQQVLDNVAMFATNPDTLPSFATIADGTTQTQDGGFVQPQFMWNATTFTGLNFPFNVQRQLVENWKLQPVMSAGRLRRMRCAFQMLFMRPTIAIGPDGKSVCPDEGCVKCIAELVNVGLLPKPSTLKLDSSEGDSPSPSGCWKFKIEAEALVYAEKLQAALDCAIPTGWFCTGCKPPKDICFVGECCGTYAWVGPGGSDAFARFTLTIMTLATVDPYYRPELALFDNREEKKANVRKALAPFLGSDGELKSIWPPGTLPHKAFQDIQDLLKQDVLTNLDLLELRTKLRELSVEANKAALTSPEARKLQAVIVRGEAAIEEVFAPPAPAPISPFDLPGTQPMSRGGGVEVVPGLLGVP